MFCRKCGTQCDDEAVVCITCGCSLISHSEKSQPKGNGIAIAGFICSFFVPILGWVFGGIGLSRAKKRNGKGKGFSIASLAIASIMFLLSFVT